MTEQTNDYNAIWQKVREEDTDRESADALPGINLFVVADNSVTLQLPSDVLVIGHPADDVYRLQAKWDGSNMFVFLPFGTKWELFASWEDGRFVMFGNRKKSLFKKIARSELAKWQDDLLMRDREMWRYPFISPDDVPVL